jgi:hypothetical protein
VREIYNNLQTTDQEIIPAWWGGGVSGVVRGTAGSVDRSDNCSVTTQRPKTSSLYRGFIVEVLSEWVVAIAIDYDILRMRIYRFPCRNHLLYCWQYSVTCKMKLEPLVAYTTFAFLYQNIRCRNTYNFLHRIEVFWNVTPCWQVNTVITDVTNDHICASIFTRRDIEYWRQPWEKCKSCLLLHFKINNNL